MAASETTGELTRIPEPETGLEPIECSELDPLHVRWLNQYVAYCQSLLGEELSSPSPDLLMVGYLKREIQRYQRLLGTDLRAQGAELEVEAEATPAD